MRLLLINNPTASSVTPRARVVIQKALSADHEVTVAFTSRRGHAARLARGAAPVTELAGPTGLRLPTVMRHLSVLEEAGLIATAKDGRVRTCALVPEAMAPMRTWLDAQRDIWESRLDRLDDYVTKLMKERER